MGQAHVNEGYELYQIITDFGDPLEIFREGIQNSFDEDATKIYVRVFEEKNLAGNKLVIEITDNGNGLHKENVNFFLMLLIQQRLMILIFLTETNMVTKDMVQKYFLMPTMLLFALKQLMVSIGHHHLMNR